MYLINSMKSYSIENIRIQDILLISICILLFLNRAVPIDYSSIWRVTVLCLIYTCIRIISKQYRNCLLHMVYIWGITEVVISILQNIAVRLNSTTIKIVCSTADFPRSSIFFSFPSPPNQKVMDLEVTPRRISTPFPSPFQDY